jgi:hypothetical protein
VAARLTREAAVVAAPPTREAVAAARLTREPAAGT